MKNGYSVRIVTDHTANMEIVLETYSGHLWASIVLDGIVQNRQPVVVGESIRATLKEMLS